ncbi:MAG: transposase family protein [Anaerolineales bacterium]|nr:transposase family protein [Anaerolineales bacterium]
MKAFTGTGHHFFGDWQAIFKGVTDPRDPELITYPLEGLLCTGVMMFMFRLGSRRQIKHQLRGNGPSQAKFETWFDVEEIPHGDTLNYGFKRLIPDEVQEVVCRMVERLIRKKVLYPWRLFDNFLVAVDGTGMLTFRERHCEYCLTKKLSSGEILYYHPILEAKLVTANGFAFSMMTEFVENTDPQADKQDCELKAFYRLAERLKKRFPRLPICLLLDGLYAGGPTFQLCEDYNWRYLIVLQDKDLLNVHRSFHTVLPLVPENHKRLLLGQRQEIVQDYRWVTRIDYEDSQDRKHYLNVITCQETKPDRQGKTSTTTFKWVTNFIPTMANVDPLANQGGRLRWKIENEGFNVQKNGGFNLEHPYSQDGTARKVFYFLLQIAYLIFQLIEKGSLFRKAFPNGVGSLKNIAFRLLEAWRNLRISPAGFRSLYSGRYQIRFDSS